jgi:hypothetical protein
VRKITLILVALALPAAAAGAAVVAGPASATLSTNRAGARPVALTVSLHTELQCGRIMGIGALVLRLPAAMRVPSTIHAAAVLVGGKPVGSVVVAGHSLTIALAPPRGAMCDSIIMGVAKIVVTRAAGLGNPRAPGTYAVKLTHGSQTFSAPLKIA